MRGAGVFNNGMAVPTGIDGVVEQIVDGDGSAVVLKNLMTGGRCGMKIPYDSASHGNPADVTLNPAANNKAAMIVLGSRSLSEFKGLLLGSISHKFSARAECTCVAAK